MTAARFTTFPGLEIAFASSVVELAGEPALVVADPPICRRWKRTLLETIGVADRAARPREVLFREHRFITGYLFRSDPPPRRRWHGRPVLRDASGLPDGTVCLLPATRWERDLVHYHARGFRRFAALPARSLNTGWRRVIASDTHRFVFLQNYKVMYSAFREFMRQAVPSLANAPQRRPR